MSDAPLKNRENEGSVAVVAVVAVILKPITATGLKEFWYPGEERLLLKFINYWHECLESRPEKCNFASKSRPEKCCLLFGV